MATISKRKGAYQIIVSLGYDEAGKQIRKTTTYRIPEGTTPKKAEKLVKEYAMEFEKKCKGMIDLDENMKYSELSELYFKNYAPNKLKEVTAYNYKKQSELHILPYLGSMKLKAITPTTITNMFAKMEVQPSTCKKIYTILQSVFSYALESRLIKESPCCAGVILPKQKYNAEQRKPFLSDSQAKELLNMLDEAGYSEFAVIIKTLLYTGMRAGDDDDKIRLNQRKPSKYKGLSRFGPEKNLQRINKFMKERPTFYKKLIQMKENFRFYLRCFYCITKVVILQFNSEKQDRISS